VVGPANSSWPSCCRGLGRSRIVPAKPTQQLVEVVRVNFQPNGVAAARSTSAGARYDRLLIVNEHHLRQVLAEYLRH
jgi:hypothetical protein